MAVDDEGLVGPRDLDAADYAGAPAYIYPAPSDAEGVGIPDHRVGRTGEPTRRYRSAVPQDPLYCPVCNRIGAGCDHFGQVAVAILNWPLLLCPSCGITYDGRVREFNKLFTFGSVGRSTATDVIIQHTLRNMDPEERKLIAFSDNRQDSALQAGHINDLQRRFQFRRSLYRALGIHGATVGTDKFLTLSTVGKAIFDAQSDADALPRYAPSGTPALWGGGLDVAYRRYLRFATLMELGQSGLRNHPGLDDVGILAIGYRALDQVAGDDSRWTGFRPLAELPASLWEDYLHGFLDIFRGDPVRGQLAVADEETLLDPAFEDDVIGKLAPEAQVHGDRMPRPGSFSDEADNQARNVQVRRLGRSPAMLAWTRRVIPDVDDPATVIQFAATALQRTAIPIHAPSSSPTCLGAARSASLPTRRNGCVADTRSSRTACRAASPMCTRLVPTRTLSSSTITTAGCSA